MQKNKDELYKKIKDLKSEKEFYEEIKKIQKETENLFDEDVSALLIVDKLGRNTQNLSTISDLKVGDECTIFGQVSNIKNQRTFSRKNGSSGKVANLEITDNTGSCGLALWDKDTDLVKNKTIQKGTKIKIINGYIKDGFNGLEINVGKYGMIEIEPENMPNIKKDKIKEIKGELIAIDPSHAFFKDNGEYGFVTNIRIKEKNNIRQIQVWDKKVKEIQKFKKGDQLIITNFDIKNKNNREEIHLNGESKISKL